VYALLSTLLTYPQDHETAPGASLATPAITQDAQLGDLLGLNAVLEMPIRRFRLQATADISTLNPDNFVAGTRSSAQLVTPLELPGHDAAQAALFARYRERLFNGSLGQQTVIYSYGAQLGGSLTLGRAPEESPERPAAETTSPLAPIRLDWNAVGGSYRATLFDTGAADTQWRAVLLARLSSSLQLWQAPPDPDADELEALRYSAVPINPGLAVGFGLVGTTAVYQEGDQQNTLAVFVSPSLTLGRLQRSWGDFTQLGLVFQGGVSDGLSPFSFDRAVDLNIISFRAAQQLYGPLVLEGGATVNIDDDSGFGGEISNSYVELKLLQRSYELGIFYSPFAGTAGIRVRFNDFSFGGSGTPFVPQPAPGGVRPLSGSR
jgi:hypothetical protein